MSDVLWLEDSNVDFPPVENALSDPDGLLAVGGDLTIDRLLEAYPKGIFPWYEEDQPILWWSPDPRCVLFPKDFHLSHSFKKKLRKQPFNITADTAFADVIQQCAKIRENREGTWITEAINTSFNQLHALGVAHSVEVWEGETLVGGLYGIAMGGVFFGESMFSLRPDASKFALYTLTQKLNEFGFHLIDCQVHNDHLESLGATTISRQQFITHLDNHISDPMASSWQPWSTNENSDL